MPMTTSLLRNRALLAVSIAVGVTYTGVGMVSPVRVLYAQAHGASLAIIGAMASAFLIANFAFQYPSGWLADRWGRRRIMVVGIAVQAILTLIYLPITNPVAFVALRFLEGMAAASVLPSARAIIADVIPAERRGEAYGVFSAFFNAGFLLGPAIGGLLASTGYASAFIGSFGMRLVAMLVVMALIEDRAAVHATTAAGRERTPRRALFAMPLLASYILAFGDYIWLGFELTLFPLWLRHHLGASIAVIGIAGTVWAIPSIIVSPIGGRIADRRRRSTLILVFGLAQVPFYAAYGLLSVVWPVVALFAFHAIAYSLTQPAVDAHVAAASPARARARVQSLYSTAGLAGAFIAANCLPYAYSLNFRLPLFIVGGSFGLCILIGATLIRLAERRTALSADAPTAVAEPA